MSSSLNPSEVGARIRRAREAAGLTQAELAEAAGIAEQSVSRIERGAYEPAFSTVCAIATALDVKLDALARGTAAPKAPRTTPTRKDVARLASTAADLSPRAVRLLSGLAEELRGEAAPSRRRGAAKKK